MKNQLDVDKSKSKSKIKNQKGKREKKQFKQQGRKQKGKTKDYAQVFADCRLAGYTRGVEQRFEPKTDILTPLPRTPVKQKVNYWTKNEKDGDEAKQLGLQVGTWTSTLVTVAWERHQLRRNIDTFLIELGPLPSRALQRCWPQAPAGFKGVDAVLWTFRFHVQAS